MTRSADIAIIGAGPGGYVAALRASQLGARVVVVEQDRPGGTCLNRGCIPTKALLEVARTLSVLRRARDMGIRVEGAVSLDLDGVRRFRDRAVRTLTLGVQQLLDAAGVEVLAGRGVLRGPGAVAVLDAGGAEAERVEAPAVVLAAGSVPAPLPLGPAAAGFWDSDAAVAMERVPEHLAVIGGGPVGVEFAAIYHALGSQVTLVEMMPRLLPREDHDVGEELARLLRRRGIRVHTGVRVRGVERLVGGGFRLALAPAATADGGPAGGGATGAGPADDVMAGDGGAGGGSPGGGAAVVEAAAVLAAVGRRPAAAGLGLENVGLDGAGWIVVDDRMATAAPGVYAVGDINGRSLLAHAASAQGIVAAEAILGRAPSVDLATVPSCTFTWPEAAGVGLTEAAARAGGHDVIAGRFPFSANGRAAASGEREGFVKVVAERGSGRLLGVHILGPDASSLIHEAGLAMAMGGRLADVERTIHAHPTFSEALAEACLAAAGRPLHLPGGAGGRDQAPEAD